MLKPSMRWFFLSLCLPSVCLFLPLAAAAEPAVGKPTPAWSPIAEGVKGAEGQAGSPASPRYMYTPTPLGVPSLQGGAGLVHVLSTDVGAPLSLRLGLHGELFRGSSFIVEGDETTQLAGRLTLAFSPWRYLEAFVQLQVGSTRNQRDDGSAAAATGSAGAASSTASRADPDVILRLGDFSLGAKGRYPITRMVDIGLELELRLVSGAGSVSISGDSTSVALTAISTFDARKLPRPLPFRVHGNLGFVVDNSINAADLSRYSLVEQTVARFGYGMERSRFLLALGAEGLLRAGPVGLSPMLEYQLAVVTASADPEVTASLPDSEGGSRVSQILTFGLRVRPPLRGLSVDLAIDVGLSSAGLAYGPPTAPYNLLLGIAWAADLWPPEPPRAPSAAAAATAARAVPPDRATLAQVEGSVVDERNQEVRATVRFAREDDRAGAVPAPVPAATPEAALARPVPAVPAPAPTPVVAESGTFVVALPAGRYRVEVSAPGFEPATTGIRLLPGSLQRLDFRLRAIAVPAPAAAAVEAGDAAASWLGERDRRERIRFDRGSFQLQAWTRAYLDRVAAAMNGPQKSARLRIIGHTDDLGAARSNSALSLRRAKVVRDYLVGRGVSPLRLIVEGAGAARPLVPGNSREARAQNRRVELVPDETAAVRGGPGAAGGGW